MVRHITNKSAAGNEKPIVRPLDPGAWEAAQLIDAWYEPRRVKLRMNAEYGCTEAENGRQQ